MSDGVLLVSDFNIDLLARYLRAAAPDAGVQSAPFGQVHQTLIGTSMPTAAAVVWARPEAVIDGFAEALALTPVDSSAVLAQVDGYVELLRAFAGRVRHLFVPSFTRTSAAAGYGLLDFSPELGLSHLLARMNLRLADGLAGTSNAHVLDAEPWLRAAGASAAMPKMWFAAKVPFGNAVFQEAALAIAAGLRAISGRSRRLLVVDLDQTLWGGVIGETGWKGIVLGGHDHVGEAYRAFQQALRALSHRGVQLAIVSKNDEAVALEAFDQHPEMVLRRADLAGWRINWHDKAANLAQLAGELNLGLASVVFIDDSPVERARVREALPEVLVPEWPEDPAKYASALWELRCFDTTALTDVDRRRSQMYAAERERRASAGAVGSIDDWLKTLDLMVTAEPLGPANLARAAQLLNKTNQLNLATRRLGPPELSAWAEADGNRLLTFSVRDRFGDSGLVGVVGVSTHGQRAELVDFLLSCRVMGRKVEEAMFHVASVVASSAGARELYARFLPTERNRPTRDILESSRLTALGDDRFVWRGEAPYPLPAAVRLQWSAPEPGR